MILLVILSVLVFILNCIVVIYVFFWFVKREESFVVFFSKMIKSFVVNGLSVFVCLVFILNIFFINLIILCEVIFIGLLISKILFILDFFLIFLVGFFLLFLKKYFYLKI